MTPDQKEKLALLRDILRKMNSALIGFSGGVDSSLLLLTAHQELGEKAFGIIACSELIPVEEYDLASSFATNYGIPLIRLDISLTEDEIFNVNPEDRCYHCKKKLFGEFKRISAKIGLNQVLEGSNADDIKTYRPGYLACKEMEIRHPLLEAGLTKADIRAIAAELGVAHWNKPASPCLATRFPYGVRITARGLEQVRESENFILGQGFSNVRVRHLEAEARIEVPYEEIERLLQQDMREHLTAFMHSQGFTYITVDLDGFRSGSLDEGIIKPHKSE